jgi:MerR family Zn(II)-responsive transcriptional regulator of zntA
MLIGEVARRAGVSRDTVRLYTRLGLLACSQRAAGSQAYAEYDDQAVELIRNIKVAQAVGFTLAELTPVIRACSAGQLDSKDQRALLEQKLRENEDKRRQLGQMSRFLRAQLERLPAS